MTTANVKIRPARRGDSEAVKALLQEIGFQSDYATVTWIIQHPEMELLVAADSFDKTVGFVAFSHRPSVRYGGRIATIDDVVVSQAHRKQGIGRALIARALERVKVLAVKRVEVQTLPNQLTDESRQFLSKVGLTPSDVITFKV